MTEDAAVSLPEAARLLGITDEAVRLAIHTDALRAAKDGRGRWRISRQAIRDYEMARTDRPRGEAVAIHKLSEADIPIIRERHAQGDTIREIAADLGVGHTAIWRVLRGITWTHVR